MATDKNEVNVGLAGNQSTGSSENHNLAMNNRCVEFDQKEKKENLLLQKIRGVLDAEILNLFFKSFELSPQELIRSVTKILEIQLSAKEVEELFRSRSEKRNQFSITLENTSPTYPVSDNNSPQEMVTRLAQSIFEYYFSFADEQNEIDLYILGICFEFGIAVSENIKNAFEYYRKAAKKNSADAQNRLGNCYLHGNGIEQDPELAFRYFFLAANQTHPIAQFNLAECFRLGTGVGKKMSLAFKYYKLSAEQQFVFAQYNLGIYCSMVIQDFKEAFLWWEKAARQGNGEALCSLGKCYVTGKGVEQNLNYAVQCFQRAADLDVSEAKLYLAHCYSEWLEPKIDLKKAHELYQQVAQRCLAETKFYSGPCHESEIGVNKDLKNAVHIWQEATEGFLDTQEALKAAKYNQKKARVEFTKKKQYQHPQMLAAFEAFKSMSVSFLENECCIIADFIDEDNKRKLS